MTARKNLIFVSVIVLFVVSLVACERTITQVLQTAPEPSSCFECHSDDNTSLVAAELQWGNSVHASGLNTNRNFPPCSACHTSEGFKDVVAGNSPGTYPNATVIHCFTCHAPHSRGDFSLRVEDPQTIADGTSEDIRLGNLCIVCHQARRNVNTYVDIGRVTFTSSHWGPHHSTQGDNLFAANGYLYDGYTYEDMQHHRNLTQDGCLDCHFRTTRNFVVGGHAFNMRALIADDPETGDVQEFTEVLNTAACTDCHGNLDDFNYNNVQDSVETLEATLKGLLITAGLIDSTGHTIKGVETSADSAGAVWNFLMIEEDRSKGVHNSKHMIGLLESAIMYMQGSLPQPTSPGSPPAMAKKRLPEPREW